MYCLDKGGNHGTPRPETVEIAMLVMAASSTPLRFPHSALEAIATSSTGVTTMNAFGDVQFGTPP